MKCFLISILLMSILANESITSAADSKSVEAACRRQMIIIHQALQYYLTANDDQLPNQLGELVGDYLSPDVLRCPAVRQSGESGAVHQGLMNPSASDGRLLGYKWELVPKEFTTGSSKSESSWSDHKRMQFNSIVGDRMPLLRCEHHATEEKPELRINLPITGKIYESKLYWETEFLDLIPAAYIMTRSLIQYAHEPITKHMRPRPKDATDQMIDLRSHYNAMIEHPWIRGDENQELDRFAEALEDGLFMGEGVVFDAAGVIQLNGKQGNEWTEGFMLPWYPKSVGDITVSSKFSEIHILGGVVYPSQPGTEVAFIDLESSNGIVVGTIPWIYGKDVVNIFDPNEDNPLIKPRYTVVYDEESDFCGQPATAHLLHMKFSNPVLDEDIVKIRLRAGNYYSSPLVLGITLIP